jgi:hypothetical protein
MLQHSQSAEARWQERMRSRLALTPSTFPADAVAVIYRPARSVMTSGKARSAQWKLRFAPRTAPFIDPLMGWTGSEDTLSQVDLTFPSAEAAIAYARRQGLDYELRGSGAPTTASVRQMANPGPRLEWVERMIEPHISRKAALAGAAPSSCYGSPGAVLRDIDLSRTAKRDVLHRWGFELIERAMANPDNAAERAQLDAVIDALLDLEEMAADMEKRRKPAAPLRTDHSMSWRSAASM